MQLYTLVRRSKKRYIDKVYRTVRDMISIIQLSPEPLYTLYNHETDQRLWRIYDNKLDARRDRMYVINGIKAQVADSVYKYFIWRDRGETAESYYAKYCNVYVIKYNRRYMSVETFCY